MKKALKSALAVVLALTMIMSCSFAATASAAGANAATTSENRECVQGKGGKMPVAEKQSIGIRMKKL